MPVPKGVRIGGRAKGTPNKVTADLKGAILGALDKVGGQAYLERVAKEQPQVFCSLLGKVLPTTLAGDPTQPLAIRLVSGVTRGEEDSEIQRVNGSANGHSPSH